MNEILSHPTPPSSQSRRVALGISIAFTALCLFGVGVFVGLWFGAQRLAGVTLPEFLSSLPTELREEDAKSDTFSKVWASIQDRYLRGPESTKTLYYGALEGLVGSLGDPYSIFLDPESTRQFSDELEGTFEGIGAEIGYNKDGQLSVIAPLPDSPAAEAGILAGDQILRIDDTDTQQLSLPSAIALIRGPKGTVVELVLAREGQPEPFTVAIERDSITLESVRWEILDGKIGYLQISSFDSRVVTLLDTALRGILVENPQSIILDLRDNPGGYLEASVDVAERFLPREGMAVVIERFANAEEKTYQTASDGTIPTLPVIVLVNSGSASASEILAGALQDHERATIIGEQTFGKGTVQDYEEFLDGSSLKLTVAEWFTPEGRSITDLGITPDIAVEEDDNPETDVQLERAKSLALEQTE